MNKTYRKITNENKLEIYYCVVDNPRDYCGKFMGKAIIMSEAYSSPDDDEYFIDVYKDTQSIADNWRHHKQLMLAQFRSSVYPVKMILPLSTIEDSTGISFSVGLNKDSQDTSFCGAYIVIKNSENNDLTNEEIESCVDGEMKKYSQWINGKVYRYEFRGDYGEIIDSCSGFYNINDIKDYIPKEYRKEYKDDDLLKYLIY